MKERTVLKPSETHGIRCEDYPWVIEMYCTPPERLAHLRDARGNGWWSILGHYSKTIPMEELLEALRNTKKTLVAPNQYAQTTAIYRLRNVVTEDVIMADIV